MLKPTILLLSFSWFGGEPGPDSDSHTVLQAMAGLESSERSPTHMSAVRHPHPWVPFHVVSPASWPQSSEASDPGERESWRESA